jgi:hypothetical protein
MIFPVALDEFENGLGGQEKGCRGGLTVKTMVVGVKYDNAWQNCKRSLLKHNFNLMLMTPVCF